MMMDLVSLFSILFCFSFSTIETSRPSRNGNDVGKSSTGTVLVFFSTVETSWPTSFSDGNDVGKFSTGTLVEFRDGNNDVKSSTGTVLGFLVPCIAPRFFLSPLNVLLAILYIWQNVGFVLNNFCNLE